MIDKQPIQGRVAILIVTSGWVGVVILIVASCWVSCDGLGSHPGGVGGGWGSSNTPSHAMLGILGRLHVASHFMLGIYEFFHA